MFVVSAAGVAPCEVGAARLRGPARARGDDEEHHEHALRARGRGLLRGGARIPTGGDQGRARGLPVTLLKHRVETFSGIVFHGLLFVFAQIDDE